MAGRPAASVTLRRVALLVPVGAAGGVAAVIAVASHPDYATTGVIVTVQVLFGARRRRRPGPRPVVGGAHHDEWR